MHPSNQHPPGPDPAAAPPGAQLGDHRGLGAGFLQDQLSGRGPPRDPTGTPKGATLLELFFEAAAPVPPGANKAPRGKTAIWGVLRHHQRAGWFVEAIARSLPAGWVMAEIENSVIR